MVTAVYSGDGVDLSGSSSALVGPASPIATIAGSTVSRFSGDGKLAIFAGLLQPESLAVDPAGDLFLSRR